MLRYFLLSIGLLLSYHLFSQESTPPQAIDSVALEKGLQMRKMASKIYRADIDSAVFYLKQSLPYFKSSREWKYYINALLTTTAVLQNAGRYEEYYASAQLTLEECKEFLGETDVLYGMALNNLGTYYYDQGNYQKAVSISRDIAKIYQLAEVEKRKRIKILQNLANHLSQAGEYQEAFECLEQILDMQETDTKTLPYLYIRTLNNIAWNYDLQSESDLAQQYFNKSMQFIEEMNFIRNKPDEINPVIRSYQGAAEIAIKQKRYSAAQKYLDKALSYQTDDQTFRKAYSYELLGRLAQRKGEDKAALGYFIRAKDIEESKKAKFKRPDLARKYLRIAEVSKDLHQRDTALWNYQKALQILAVDFTSDLLVDNPEPVFLFSKLDALSVLEGKGQLLWESYQTSQDTTYLRASFNAFQTGVDIINTIRQGVVSLEAKNTLSERTVPVYEGAIQAVMERYRISGNPKLLDHALSLAERNKSLLLIEAFNEQAALGLTGLPDSLLQQDKELRLGIAFYQRKILTGKKDHPRLKDWKAQLFKLKRELDALTDQFEKDYPRFYAQKYEHIAFDLSSGQDHLGSHEQAAIEYFVGEEKVYGFVVWKEGFEVFEVAHEDQLFEAIERLRSSISQAPKDAEVLENYQAFSQSAYHLYTQLLQPALEHLPPSIRSLKIIPDERFNYIPFDLLLMAKAPADEVYFSSDHLEYVLEHYQISYDYSLTWMLKNRKTQQDYEKTFIAYAPSFQRAGASVVTRSCQADELYQLECSEAEVQAINDLLEGKIRIGNAALTSNFGKEAADYRIIHMATHACADEENPLLNKIFLTDDYLSNADLYNTSLNAELVVLSACNTGSGKLVRGEGVLSLARGFVQSGCASSVVSRWSVDDCATSAIMTGFYEGLQAGTEKHEALRQSKLRFLSEADQLRSHPYYWSAFVAYGDMSAMNFSSLNWWWIIGFLGGVALALLLIFWSRKKGAA